MDTLHRTESGIACTAIDGGAVVAMWGEVDAALRGRASDAMSDVLARPGRIEIDVADVTFIDSSGLAFILQLYLLGREEGREVVVCDPTESLEDLLAMIGMRGVIPVARSGAARARAVAPVG